VVPGPVSRAIREELPEAVAWAVIEFANGPLVDNPRRVGAELRGHLRGIHSAHLATFRIQYVIDDERRAWADVRADPPPRMTYPASDGGR
jgi:mRNA-degrading endonuclease RelE of RelBE toxin-antitoxin system